MSRGESRVLLLGASGFLGPALADAFGVRNALQTYARHPVPGARRYDALADRVESLWERPEARPGAAVLLLGRTRIRDCALDPVGSAALNVTAIVRAIDELRALGIVPVFASSDAVFDGTHAHWREDEAVHPVLTYGRQKREVERYLISLPPPWLIVRLPPLLSPRRHPRCMLSDWVDKLGREEHIRCWTDQYFSPADVTEVAKTIAHLVRAGAQGLYHVGGGERLSRRELLQAVIDEYRVFAAPRASIEDCRLGDGRIDETESRPRDTSMDSSLLAAGYGLRLRGATSAAVSAVRDWFRAPAS